uniref:Uncharacterized protein n=1 Tax=Alexandrium monilatum TaxID=311494 RepID=A0A7S4QN56_9DINO|mmetsp:Transcript_24975/g.74486  ORF Transcript_24975/g.74486 Transcript_24975/m.74486 type:complete len:323 (+) Transcript_24975:66-1034(+)
MPNRGKLVYFKKCEFEEQFVYNVVKRALNISGLKKGAQLRAEKALKHAAHKVHLLMREHEEEPDVGRTLDALEQLELHMQIVEVPSRLGREAGRQIFEELVGPTEVLEPTVEYVNHGDKPGMPAPVNLYTTSPFGSDAEDEELAQVSDDGRSEGSADSSDKEFSSEWAAASSQLPRSIWLLEYSRSPKEFLNALLLSPELAACRDALTRQGLDFKLKGGAKVFVRPEQHRFVVKAAKGRQLKPRHVIVAEEFEGSLERALQDVGKGVKTKARAALPPQPMLIKRTFLDFPVPSSLRSEPNSDPVTVSTSDANPRIQVNPRAA